MGFELSQLPTGKPAVSESRGSKSGNIGDGSGFGAPSTPYTPADPELAAVIALWPSLPPAIRAGVLALVKAAGAAG